MMPDASEPQSLAELASSAAANPDVWELRLYVAGKTAKSVAAFENLPGLLLTAVRSERVGVMIAGGDLAVEDDVAHGQVRVLLGGQPVYRSERVVHHHVAQVGID